MIEKSKIKILVVDDEKGIRELFRYMLDPERFDVTTAANGLEGVLAVRRERYDLVFLDVHMPKMRGPEALVEMKKIKPDIKIIISSSSSDPDFIFERQVKDKGAIECIFKPCEVQGIMEIIERETG